MKPVYAGAFLAILVGVVYLYTAIVSNFKQDTAADCFVIKKDKFVILDRIFYVCPNKESDFYLLPAINHRGTVSKEKTAQMRVLEKYSALARCETQLSKLTDCCMDLTFKCPDVQAQLKMTRDLHQLSAPVYSKDGDLTPTIEQSPFSDCILSQEAGSLRAACTGFTVTFRPEDFTLTVPAIEYSNPEWTFNWFFAHRDEVFSFFGFNTTASGTECIPEKITCGEGCFTYQCSGSEGYFAVRFLAGKAKVMSVWGSIG